MVNRLKKTLKFFTLAVASMATLLVLYLILNNNSVENTFDGTQIFVVKNYADSLERANYNDLLKEFGNHKKLPRGFELQALIALSHYPELKNTNIKFELVDVEGSLYSQPEAKSLLSPGSERTYIVLIDTIKNGNLSTLTLLKNLPFNAQIGVLSHELAHTSYYLNKSSLYLLGDMIRYGCSSSYEKKFENETEQRVIDHGAGFQLLAWSNFQYEVKIREKKGHLYFSPEKIKDILQNNHHYIALWNTKDE
ncbi:MAG: hypothetical protein IT262_04755 [Saprospiraceae bacterium]|nr:hypothetical protein [Saprospiraceae bacterium]